MTTTPSGPDIDLRRHAVEELLEQVERRLEVRLDGNTVVLKRRSVGARTDRDTWVRIERRPLAGIDGQGWNGTECAATLEGIAKPHWYSGASWRGPDGTAMWRADETELLPDEPVSSAVTTCDPELPDEWWQALNSSLDALATQHTTRIATPDTVTITQGHVGNIIRAVFPEITDTIIEQWVPAHADMTWANITGPEFCLFDWEDWGLAPGGLDSASLWSNALAVPQLADRVRKERHHDLETQDGRLMMLFYCAKIVGTHGHSEDPRLEPARHAADRIVESLLAA
ncbi:hypothetical protein OG453_07635 [Streptomyces sp. NBC_01381]|uniref:hypothetical protein n=1 Tax=Streptomyces sp. NBC_01381 TaxID=2903845 RepID=UPI002253F2B4|nr:hypothetical protein [Streptomyces sp. NBC_01381]MCX4666541.1 hypothetical protein [Streptomyces sp. NBC_01381]